VSLNLTYVVLTESRECKKQCEDDVECIHVQFD
jgi:hypothetical protein